jgi:hypothetical protein
MSGCTRGCSSVMSEGLFQQSCVNVPGVFCAIIRDMESVTKVESQRQYCMVDIINYLKQYHVIPIERYESFFIEKAPDVTISYVLNNFLVDSLEAYIQSFSLALKQNDSAFETEIPTYWIDVLFLDQKLPDGIGKMVDSIENMVMYTKYHLVIYSDSFLDEALCVYELFLRRKQGNNSIIVVNVTNVDEWTPRNYGDSIDYCSNMVCSHVGSLYGEIRRRLIGKETEVNCIIKDIVKEFTAVITYADKSWYYGNCKGGWRDDESNGQFSYPNGDSFKGVFKLNKFIQGDVVIHLPNKGIYEGQYKEGKYNGIGILKFPEGIICQGEFKNGEYSPDGMVLYPDNVSVKRSQIDERLWRSFSMEPVNVLQGHTSTVKCILVMRCLSIYS